MKEFLNFLKLPPNILAAISLATGIILFVPEKILNKLYMSDFRNEYGFIISIVFLTSISLLFIFLISKAYKKLKKHVSDKKLEEGRIKYLLNAEKAKVKRIKNLIKAETHTLSFPMNDGLTKEFEYFGIIAQAGNTQPIEFGYNDEMYIKYFLQPWVINLISKNEELKKIYK